MQREITSMETRTIVKFYYLLPNGIADYQMSIKNDDYFNIYIVASEIYYYNIYHNKLQSFYYNLSFKYNIFALDSVVR